MKHLSSRIEKSIMNALQGMVMDIKIEDVDDKKLTALVNSRMDSFSSIKTMIMLWQNSPNAPNKEKLKTYATKLIKAGENSVDILEDALSKKIDFAKLDAQDHGTAMKSKPVILKAITELESGLIELRNQIKNDKLDFKEREFLRGYPERFANQEFYPISDYHKQWHNKEEDAVMICPKGTMGETIILGGLKIQLPQVPKNKKEILFSSLPVEEQYWRRLDVPPGLSVENESVYIDYILEEFRRRREGIWFMINGKPVYLTGSHYFALQWCMLRDDRYVGYMNFRYAQAKMFYHTEACVLDPRCIGQIFVKSRRTGFTYEKIFRILNEATSTNNANFGMTSKSDEDAKKAFKKLSYAFLNLPFFFRPVVKSKEDSDVKLEFAKPSENSKIAKKNRDTKTSDYLNTTIDYEPTKESAYDGQAMYRYLADEASKWTRGNSFLKHWGEVAPTLDEGGTIVGKAFVGSTVAAMKDGGKDYMQLHSMSNLLLRDNTTGRTPSGLYPYFLPAHENMTEFTDKYGICHEIIEEGYFFYNTKEIKKTIGSLQFLEAKRKAKRRASQVDYNNELRAFPITIDDAFRDELQSQLFDIEKINAQIKYNRNPEVQAQLMKGNFYWKDGIKDSTVIWKPESNGRFLITWIPDEEIRNKWIRKNVFGHLTKCPINEHIGAFGCDPYDQSAVIDAKLVSGENGAEYDKGSKGAMHGLTGFNLGNIPSNYFFLEYIARPKTADMFFEDVLMACIFYSMPVLVENNKKLMLKHFRSRGYRGFVMSRFDKDVNRLSVDEKELGGLPNSSEDIKNYHWSAIEEYVDKYVGEYKAEEGEEPIREEGIIGSMPFNRTLEDWLKFDVANRTKYDASISSGFAIMAINRNKYKPKVEAPKINLKFKTY